MKAVRWYGKGDVRVEEVPDPKIQDDRDVIIRISSSAICGSDLHIYDGLSFPAWKKAISLGTSLWASSSKRAAPSSGSTSATES